MKCKEVGYEMVHDERTGFQLEYQGIVGNDCFEEEDRSLLLLMYYIPFGFELDVFVDGAVLNNIDAGEEDCTSSE